MILDNQLEDELEAVGWLRKKGQKVGVDAAYDCVRRSIQHFQKEKIRNSELGRVFDMVLEEIGLIPDNIWGVPTIK